MLDNLDKQLPKKVVVQVNTAFKTQYFLIICTDVSLLANFNVADDVTILYYLDNSRKILVKITHTSLDTCPANKCDAYLEAENAQRWYCPLCTDIPDYSKHKKLMRFLGCKLVDTQIIAFFGDCNMVFKSDFIASCNPLYDRILYHLNYDSCYWVLAWYNTGKSFWFDILDIDNHIANIYNLGENAQMRFS